MNLKEFKKMWEDWSFREEEKHTNGQGQEVIEFAMTLVNLRGRVYDESYGRHMACRLVFGNDGEIVGQEFWNIISNANGYQIASASGNGVAPAWFTARFAWATDANATTSATDTYYQGSSTTY